MRRWVCQVVLLAGGYFHEYLSESPNLSVLGACQPIACYANCDESTVAPILNVSDFLCFMNGFAAGDPRANCDQSVVAPIFTVNDFVCFLNRFGAGCG